jgi:ribosomal-protein-alanine N-acetyltransferase
VDVLHRLWTNPDVRRYLWDNNVISRERAEEAVRDSLDCVERHGVGHWLVLLGDTEATAGFCGFIVREEGEDPELMYGLAPEYWGRGLITEAASAALQWAFLARGFSRITAATDPPNTASIRVMERLGMRFLRRGTLNGLATVFYELMRDEFRAPAATKNAKS